MNRVFERCGDLLHAVSSDAGIVTSATSASSGEMMNIITSTPIEREHRGEQLAERLLQALGDVVDVVGDPAEQVAAGLAVDVARAAGGCSLSSTSARSRNIVRCTTPARTYDCR